MSKNLPEIFAKPKMVLLEAIWLFYGSYLRRIGDSQPGYNRRYWFCGFIRPSNEDESKDNVFLKIINLDKMKKIKMSYADFEKQFETKSYGRCSTMYPIRYSIDEDQKIHKLIYSEW